MVLRCDKTGKLFFSHKEAEVHGEETGFQAFSQVSLDEKVWVCKETGKQCFNQEQIDLHKRRVPEAQTWDEKTIADLRTEKSAKEVGGPVEMETEEDIIRREAGLKPLKPKEPTGPLAITKENIDQLLEMGFTQLRAEKALVRTSNGGLEAAINWLTEHLEDADIDEPLGEGVYETKTQEELGEEAAKKLAGAGSQLTAEEKKAKANELLAKARAKKHGTTVEEEKQKEKARRAGGKDTVSAKRDFEDSQKQRDIEARKREKREFELERQKLREKLAAGGFKRSYAVPPMTLEEATEKITSLSDTKSAPALTMMKKLVDNIAKGPAEPKFRKVRLSNAKVAEGLVHVVGARQFMMAIGWSLVEDEFLQLPDSADAAAQVTAVNGLMQACAAAVEARRVAELEARKKETADRLAKQKAERDAIKAQMAKDRGEVKARGPAEASVAKKLPTGDGGFSSSRKFMDEQDEEDKRNAR